MDDKVAAAKSDIKLQYKLQLILKLTAIIGRSKETGNPRQIECTCKQKIQEQQEYESTNGKDESCHNQSGVQCIPWYLEEAQVWALAAAATDGKGQVNDP